MVASSRMALARYGVVAHVCELLRVAEHGSILCIQILIAGETHVAPTKFCRQSDADVSGWQPACIRLF